LSPVGAHLADLAAWVNGEVDVTRCVDLARGFMAVDWAKWPTAGHQLSAPARNKQPDDAWAVLRLCCLSWPLDADRDIALDPELLRRLDTGDLPEAFRIASERLRAHGIRSALRLVVVDAARTRLWASGLTFPIARATAVRLLHIVQPSTSKDRLHDRES
jgi:CRISPR-associated protein Csx17